MFTNHNPALLRSLHYFSALHKVICVARNSMITYDFKRLAAKSGFQEIDKHETFPGPAFATIFTAFLLIASRLSAHSRSERLGQRRAAFSHCAIQCA
jgi:hypothetical protein